MWKSKGMNDVKVPKPHKSTAFPPYLVLLLPTVWEIVGVYFHSLPHEKLKGEAIFYFPICHWYNSTYLNRKSKHSPPTFAAQNASHQMSPRPALGMYEEHG